MSRKDDRLTLPATRKQIAFAVALLEKQVNIQMPIEVFREQITEKLSKLTVEECSRLIDNLRSL